MASSSVITKPDVLVIGAPKAGTTWVNEFFSADERFFVPKAKDTYYFDRHFDRGDTWYHSHFEQARDDQIAVEVCHDYMYSSEALDRIADYFHGEPRAIIVLRDPVSRALSHLRYSHQLGNVASLDDSALVENPSIVALSKYENHLADVRERLGDGVSVVFFENLRQDPERFARELVLTCGGDASADLALPGRTNAGGVARSRSVARGAIKVARGLDRVGARTVVGVLKSSPLRRVLFDTTAAPEIAPSVRDRLEVELAESRTRTIALLQELDFCDVDQIPAEWAP